MPGTCAWLVRKTAELTAMTLEDQVPGGVRGSCHRNEVDAIGALPVAQSTVMAAIVQ